MSTRAEQAEAVIGQLLFSAQGFGCLTLRDCVAEAYELICGERPTDEALNRMLGGEGE